FLESVVRAEPRLVAERRFLRNAYYGRGNAKLDLRRLDEAFDDFSRAIELDATYAPPWFGRGVVYGLQGKPVKAVEEYSRAIQAGPGSFDAWSSRGCVYCDTLNQPEKAVADFSKAIELRPKKAAYRSNRGNAYKKMGRYLEAIADFSKAIELDGKYVDAWQNRGDAYFRLGQYEKALTDSQTAVKLAPERPGGHNQLAWLLATCPDASVRDPARAVESAKKAVELAPGDPNRLGTLGTAYYRAGDWKAAIAALNKSWEITKNGDAYIWLFLAMSHQKLGNASESRKY